LVANGYALRIDADVIAVNNVKFSRTIQHRAREPKRLA
jgi:hypothetical protein